MPSLRVEEFVLTTNTHGVDLKAPMKKYTRNTGSATGSNGTGAILLLGHGAGFSKETWEPTIEDLFKLDAGAKGGYIIREAWALDCQNHGDGCILNEGILCIDQSLVNIWDYGNAFATLVKSGLLGAFARDRNPIILCGHSAGAVGVTLATEFFNPPSRLPFSRIVLIEPAMTSKAFDDKESDIYQFVKSTTPTRKDIWKSADAAAAWLKARLPWAAWDERVFDVYVKHGLRALPTAYYPDKMSGVTLTTHRLAENIAFEGKQYASNALNRLNQICVHIPVHLIFGGKNDLFEREAQDSLIDPKESRVFASVTRIEGVGHLVVQEAPTQLATAVFNALTFNQSPTELTSKL
ncbi:unnamed protein product [Cyclocybe aegerita]|uniref:AB hydrolase-1 domain-containing protein n=1 Tax=Cyclocybe aegerita TaxID=1973307 RepID=A0A8S0WY92_CYCAE|nr:unnamed protein product [Cyclocybe aegerita]